MIKKMKLIVLTFESQHISTFKARKCTKPVILGNRKPMTRLPASINRITHVLHHPKVYIANQLPNATSYMAICRQKSNSQGSEKLVATRNYITGSTVFVLEFINFSNFEPLLRQIVRFRCLVLR